MQILSNCLVFLWYKTMDVLYNYALALLRKVSTDAGFTAAPVKQDNYFRIWTRDAIVCGIACTTTDDHDLHATFKQSLQTIWQHQHPTGFLPGNVTPHSGQPGYGNSAGRADNTCWGIIGACLYASATGDRLFLKSIKKNIERAFAVMDAWEYNGKHLLYVPQSGDWADEYIQHGYILFDQLLRYWALKLAAKMLNKKAYKEKAAQVKQAIEYNFYYRNESENWYCVQLSRMKDNAPVGFWWMGFNPSQLYPQFDLQANTLALLLNIGTAQQQHDTIRWIRGMMNEYELLLPSFYPAIEENDRLMDELENNYAYRFRNKPHEFHNGGLWPVWNGWACAAIYAHNKTLHQLLLNRMETSLSGEDAGFNECMNGLTGWPCGVPKCAWSAAGYLIARNAASFQKIVQL
jgi:hypothetical protein